MNAPLISLIIPVYKAEKYFRKCVDSVLAQTYTNIELILVDDGSPDSCPVICDQYAAKDSRIVVIHQPNAGVSAARNAGLEAAKGEYIGLIDDDDWIEPDMYEVLYAVIKSSGADIAASYSCTGNYRPAQVSGNNYTVFSPEEALKKMLDNQCDFTCTWGKLYTRKVIKDIRFIPSLTLAEDVVFETQAIVNSRKIAYIHYQCYHYVIHSDSVSHSLGKSPLSVLDSIDIVIDVLKRFNGDLAQYAENHVAHFDLYLAKQLENRGYLSPDAYGKITAHIGKYRSADSWNLLDFRRKCGISLLLFGRVPFIAGRKLLRTFRKFGKP